MVSARLARLLAGRHGGRHRAAARPGEWATQAGANVIQISASRTTSMKIAKGKPKTIKTSMPFYKIVIGDPRSPTSIR